jgi:hypothetical protein
VHGRAALRRGLLVRKPLKEKIMPHLLYCHPCRDRGGEYLGDAWVYPESDPPDPAEILREIPDAIIRKLVPDCIEVFVPGGCFGASANYSQGTLGKQT